MHWGRIQANWKDFKGRVKERWEKLTDDELDAIEGRREPLCGRLQKAYGISKEEAERQIDDFGDTFEMDVTAQATERNI